MLGRNAIRTEDVDFMKRVADALLLEREANNACVDAALKSEELDRWSGLSRSLPEFQLPI